MNTKQIFLTAALGLGVVVTANAQLQLSASGSYLKGTGDNKSSLWGGGLTGKVFLGNSIALGGTLHSYPKQTNKITGSGPSGTYTYTSADLVTNVGAALDVLLLPKTSLVQPYIGTDAGVSFNNQTVTYTDGSNQIVSNKNNKSYFLLSPKAGLNIGLGQAFGIFGQAQYNFAFGSGDPKSINIGGVPNPITTEPVSKYFTFDAGIYVRLKGAGK
jgi:hypothetical protein